MSEAEVGTPTSGKKLKKSKSKDKPPKSEGKRKREAAPAEAASAEAAPAVTGDAAPETASPSKSKQRRTNDEIPPAASADAITPKNGDKERRKKKKAKLDGALAAAGEAGEEAAGKRKAGAEEGAAPKKAKKRKSEAGAAQGGDCGVVAAADGTVTKSGSAWAGKKKLKGKKVLHTKGSYKYTCFFGQLPYRMTAERLREVIKRDAGVDDASVRMLTDKTTKQFRGMAFVDVTTESDRKRLLRLHHTKIGERKINVERVNFRGTGGAKGGEPAVGGDGEEASDGEQGTKERGPSKESKAKWEQSRGSRHVKVAKENRRVKPEELERLVGAACNASNGSLKREDFDAQNMSFLALLEKPVVSEALKEAVKRSNKPSVRNRQAYFMGIVVRVSKKHEEAKSQGNTGPKGYVPARKKKPAAAAA